MKVAGIIRRICEFLVLYALVPILILLGVLPRNPILLLFPTFLLMFLILRKDPLFDRKYLFNFRGAAGNLKHVIIRAIWVMPILLLLVYLFAPDQFLLFPRERTLIWIIVMLLYPLLSVYPQEIIFRAFLFHRYSCLFRNTPAKVLASALTFGFVHIIFGNWLSVVLSSLGGVLFALTYAKSRSMLLVSIEHAIYGNAIFTVGLGQFFFHGTFRT